MKIEVRSGLQNEIDIESDFNTIWSREPLVGRKASSSLRRYIQNTLSTQNSEVRTLSYKKDCLCANIKYFRKIKYVLQESIYYRMGSGPPGW